MRPSRTAEYARSAGACHVILEWTRTIDALGFPPEAASAYRRCVEARRGLVVIAGQRESGITTTLYAGLLHVIAGAARRIVTVEDPVAYPLDGVAQLAVDAARGFFFDAGIEAARQRDADVIMVGGLFDSATVAQVVDAARSCLVIATLHCVSSSDVVPQLIARGAGAREIEEVLLGTFVQELVVRVDHWIR